CWQGCGRQALDILCEHSALSNQHSAPEHPPRPEGLRGEKNCTRAECWWLIADCSPPAAKPCCSTRGTKRQLSSEVTPTVPEAPLRASWRTWCCAPPTGTTSRPPGASCSSSGGGTRGAAAATIIAS